MYSIYVCFDAYRIEGLASRVDPVFRNLHPSPSEVPPKANPKERKKKREKKKKGKFN